MTDSYGAVILSFHNSGMVLNDLIMGMDIACMILQMLPDCSLCKNTADAATHGHVKCIKYLRKNGYEWHKDTCAYAAMNGHLKCLKYARKNGCKWDKRVCIFAAEYGHLGCLKYAHKNGCPWDIRICERAAENGYLKCLEYAVNNKCPGYKKYINH